MADQVSRAIYLVVFAGAVDIIANENLSYARKIRNAAASSLESALRSGRVQYFGGVFSGEFGARVAAEIRRLGGRWDKRMGIYFIDKDLVPEWVKAAAESFRSTAKAMHDAIMKTLDDTESDLDRIVEAQHIDAEKTIDHIQDGFKSAADAIGVSPQITPESKAILKKEYSANMKLYIRDFSREAIRTLRKVVEENAMKGYRIDRLASMVRQRYGVSRSKATFLARQETALFMAKYRERRFVEGGVDRYVWQTAGDERVRESHEALDGRIFFYDKKAPARYFSTGTPCNPGEDFNCRCVDKPVIERRSA